MGSLEAIKAQLEDIKERVRDEYGINTDIEEMIVDLIGTIDIMSLDDRLAQI